MTRPLVYVAGPITSDPWGCVRRAAPVYRTLRRQGLRAYLPQLSVLHEMIDPQTHSEWLDDGVNMVERCNGFVRLPGQSVGAEIEHGVAVKTGLPVLLWDHAEVWPMDAVDLFAAWVDEVRRHHLSGHLPSDPDRGTA